MALIEPKVILGQVLVQEHRGHRVVPGRDVWFDMRPLAPERLGIELRIYPFYFPLAGTGMRVGEGRALQREDVNVGVREIRVTQTLSARRVETPKAGHGRTVDIPQALASTLARL